jgi:hypothetical protein
VVCARGLRRTLGELLLVGRNVRVAELDQALAVRGLARVLAEHERPAAVLRVFDAHTLGGHDLVGGRVREDAVLMDAALVREGVGAHDRLVGLHEDARVGGHHLRRAHDLPRVDVAVHREVLRARPEGHDHLLERRVACALAEGIERDLNLPRTALHRRQRVGRREPQVVVTMRRPDDVPASCGGLLDQIRKEVGVL